ncbi:hypothetical protein E7811_11860 [Aliigemmobacter aestuarii]|uniref:Uncharacterized protein n=2 Tax=Aliigemmobacter aestuarii TaxID=1445661 RepID=A0A4S3MKX0_9RHOB|nr:hypothetical protein E7811_11860 [Gemmobacter aestuarii]
MFRKRGLRSDRLQSLAREAMDRSRLGINFLQSASERVGLYGCFSFASENPELFDHLMRTVRHDQARLLWNMDMLAQLHFVRTHIDPDQIVLVDEGLLHRGIASYIDQGVSDEFRDFLDCVTDEFVTIIFDAPIKVCMDRAAARPKGMPLLFRDLSPLAREGMFHRFSEMIEVAAATRIERGDTVLRIDTTQPANLSAWEMARAVQIAAMTARKQAESPEIAARRLPARS